MKQGLMTLIVIIGIGAIDQMAGFWARHALTDHRSLWMIKPIFSFHLLFNRGAMLGFLSGHSELVTILSVLGTGALLVASWRSTNYSWPLSIMAGGALGNTFSRIVFGKVTDFMRISGYPGIFDVADVALRVGVVWFIITLIMVEFRTNRRSSGILDQGNH